MLARQGVVAERLPSYGLAVISAALEDHVALSAVERMSLAMALGTGERAPTAVPTIEPTAGHAPTMAPAAVPATTAYVPVPPAPARPPAPAPAPTQHAPPQAPTTVDACRRALVAGGHSHRMPGSVQSLAFYQQLWRECIGCLYAPLASPAAVAGSPPIVPPAPAPAPTPPPAMAALPPIVPPPTTAPSAAPSTTPAPHASAAAAFQAQLLATAGTRELFANVPVACVLEAVRHCCEAVGVSFTSSPGMVVSILGVRIAQALAAANVRAEQAVQRAVDAGCPPEGVPGVVLAQLPPAGGAGGPNRSAQLPSSGRASGGALDAAARAAARMAARPGDMQAIERLHTLSGESGSDDRLRAQVSSLSLDAGMGADLCLLLAQENLDSIKSGVLAALDPLASRAYALVSDVRERLLGARVRHYERLFSTGMASPVAKLVEAAAAGKLTSELVVGKALGAFPMLCVWAPLTALVRESSPRDSTAGQALLEMHAEAFGRGHGTPRPEDLSIELAVTPVFTAYAAEFARYARGGLAAAPTWSSIREQVDKRSGREALLRMSAAAAREGSGAGREAAAERDRKAKAAKEREEREEAKKAEKAAKEAGAAAAAAAAGAPAAAPAAVPAPAKK